MTTMRHLDESVTRAMPANIDAEQALIGACLINNDAFRKVSTLVEVEHFHEEAHRQIWHVLAAQIGKGQVANPVTLITYLGNEDFGGVSVGQYLARLASTATSVINAPDYARMIRDMAMRRRLITIGQSLVSIAFDAPVEATAETIYADLERELEEARPALSGDLVDFQAFDRISSADVYDAYQRGTGIVGLSTGLPRLDAVLGGLQNSDLIVIAGRPAMGKTALVTNIAVHVARHVEQRQKQGDRLGVVGFSSLEMGAAQLKQRILSDLANVPFWKLKRGIASQSEMERYHDAERSFRTLPLAIDQTGGLNIAQLKMRARALKKRRGLSLLVVDYLQLLTGSRRHNSRNDEVAEITTSLKALAKELDVPVIALSQLSREVEKRDDRRPKLSDLRESGSIEQDADSVLFVYREEYYLGKAKPRQEGTDLHLAWERDMRRWSGIAEVIIGKNRHGPEDTAELGFEGEFTRFTNEPAPREIDPEETRQRSEKRRLSLPKEATILKGILRSLTVNKGHLATADQRRADHRLPAGARLLAIEDAWRSYGTELLPTESEDKQKAGFRAAFKHLRAAEIAFYTGSEETGFFCALPEVWD